MHDDENRFKETADGNEQYDSGRDAGGKEENAGQSSATKLPEFLVIKPPVIGDDRRELEHSDDNDQKDAIESVNDVSSSDRPQEDEKIPSAHESGGPEDNLLTLPASAAVTQRVTGFQRSERSSGDKGFVQEGSDDTFTLAFVGGRSVGKTYLFQALVNSLSDSENSGALSYFINVNDPVQLFRKTEGEERFRIISMSKYLKGFNNWDRLGGTQIGFQHSYQLRIPFSVGLLAKKKRSMYIEYFDGAGEHLVSKSDHSESTWLKHYQDAEVMVFCLPFWAAFPTADHQDAISPKSDDYRLELEETISSFEEVVHNYDALRKIHGIDTKVKCVVALTQADQIRYTTLGQDLADTWMYPFTRPPEVAEEDFRDTVEEYLVKLRSGAGVNRYLANARNLSDILRKEIKKNKPINGALKYLDYGCGEPWLIPMSAISGELLDSVESGGPPNHEPVSAHVELPLLVALSKSCNALM